ncbi:MAG: Gp49 family protein [Aristaeellaceae bacterium]
MMDMAKVDGLMAKSRYEKRRMGEKTFVVLCRLPSGFEVTEACACVNPADFDEVLAEEICVRKIREKLSGYEAYAQSVQRDAYSRGEKADKGARLVMHGVTWATAMVAALTNARARVRIPGWADGMCVRGGIKQERGKLLMMHTQGEEYTWMPTEKEMRCDSWDVWEVSV